jgi:hypothetical protein
VLIPGHCYVAFQADNELVLAKTSNKLIRMRGFRIDYIAHTQEGGIIEHAQQIANLESPKTTKLYDRT